MEKKIEETEGEDDERGGGRGEGNAVLSFIEDDLVEFHK